MSVQAIQKELGRDFKDITDESSKEIFDSFCQSNEIRAWTDDSTSELDGAIHELAFRNAIRKSVELFRLNVSVRATTYPQTITAKVCISPNAYIGII